MLFTLRRDWAIPAGHHVGGDVFGMAGAGERVGVVGADEGDVEVGGDLFVHAEGPEDTVDDEATVVFVEDVFGRALGGVEHAAFFAVFAAVLAGPGTGDFGLGFVVRRTGLERYQGLGVGKDFEVGTGFAVVAAGVGEGAVLNATQDGMVFGFGLEQDLAALAVVCAVVADPGVAENLVAEAFFVAFDGGTEVVLEPLAFLGDLEPVGGGAQADDGAVAV